AETARFALTEVTLGIMPGGGGTQTLPRAIGERRAKELILTGKPFTAAEARDWGLVNEVYPRSDLLRESLATASRSKSRPITAWFRPRIAAKACWPSTRSGHPILRGDESAAQSNKFGVWFT